VLFRCCLVVLTWLLLFGLLLFDLLLFGLVQPGSHLMTEAEIDDATEDMFYILKIPPFTCLYFDGQLAHAGPLFHVPTLR